jgi:hypothetical protein
MQKLILRMQLRLEQTGHMNRLMNNCSSSLCAGLVFMSVTMSTLRANEVTHHDLAKKVSDADFIVLGEVVSIQAVVVSDAITLEYAVVLPMQNIKGRKQPGQLRVLMSGPISEFDPECCEVGTSYLFFVEHAGDELYRSVNGRYGIYKLAGDAVINWYPTDQDVTTELMTVRQEIAEFLKQK